MCVSVSVCVCVCMRDGCKNTHTEKYVYILTRANTGIQCT